MELTPGQRKAVFAGIVLALAALGAFLFIPGSLLTGSGDRGRPAAATRPLHRASPTPPSATPAGLGAATPAGLGAGAPPTASGVNIYQWLPFTQAGLAAAATVVRRFAADYTAYTYTESPASYVDRMKGLVTAQLAVTLERAYAAPGVAQLRAQQKQASTGAGRITALRAFGPSSMTFLVAVAQQVTGTQGTSRNTIDYAVTVTGAGTRWQVNDVEYASAGNS
jgi:hypothetical protein